MDEKHGGGEMKNELIKLYKQFCNYVVETNPNYTDSDFSFEIFMEYLQIEEWKKDLERKAY